MCSTVDRDMIDSFCENVIAVLKEQEYKDKMSHALEDDWKRLNELLKKQEAIIEQLNRFVNGFSMEAVPVVRCKNCKHGEKTPTFKYDLEEIKKKLPKGVFIIEPGHDVTWCNKHLTSNNDDWFCADGVRVE